MKSCPEVTNFFFFLLSDISGKNAMKQKSIGFEVRTWVQVLLSLGSHFTSLLGLNFLIHWWWGGNNNIGL